MMDIFLTTHNKVSTVFVLAVQIRTTPTPIVKIKAPPTGVL